jgi:hypothetical protein
MEISQAEAEYRAYPGANKKYTPQNFHKIFSVIVIQRLNEEKQQLFYFLYSFWVKYTEP